MLIKMVPTATAAGPMGVLIGGMEYDLDEATARSLVLGGYAVSIEPEIVPPQVVAIEAGPQPVADRIPKRRKAARG